MRPETIIVETDNGSVMINKSDFDPAIHRLPGAATDMAIPPGAGGDVDANGNTVNAGDGGQMVPPLATEPPQTPAPPAPVQMAVTKKGKKFVVVDTAGNAIERDGIEKDGYASDTEAWAAITALSIPKA